MIDAAGPLAAVPAHPNLLMHSAVAADAAVDVRSIGAVLEVISAGCGQGAVQCRRPLLVGFGEPPYLTGGRPRSRSTAGTAGPRRWHRGAAAVPRLVAAAALGLVSTIAWCRCAHADIGCSGTQHANALTCRAPRWSRSNARGFSLRDPYGVHNPPWSSTSQPTALT